MQGQLTKELLDQLRRVRLAAGLADTRPKDRPKRRRPHRLDGGFAIPKSSKRRRVDEAEGQMEEKNVREQNTNDSFQPPMYHYLERFLRT